MSVNPYTVAAGITVWAGTVVSIVALFMGRDRLLDDWKRYCAEYAAEHQDANQQVSGGDPS